MIMWTQVNKIIKNWSSDAAAPWPYQQFGILIAWNLKVQHEPADLSPQQVHVGGRT